MIHVYVVVESDIDEAITKGFTDLEQPSYNRSVRYSLDGTKAIMEGMFTEEEFQWFEQHGIVFTDAEPVRNYVNEHRVEWETPDSDL